MSYIILTRIGYYNIKFSKGKTYIFNTNTFSNTESYLKEIYYLDKGGDI